MALWQNIPFLCILLPLGSAALTSVLKKNAAKVWAMTVISVVFAASCLFLGLMIRNPQSYTYTMGHYTAPWGNEIRAGVTEALAAFFFSLIMLMSFIGGWKKLNEHVLDDKQPLYCVMLLLLTAALMAQIYTNDIFTAYVFVEIMTIAACSLIDARTTGRTLVASTRYMIMNLLGSGLFLLGIVMLYDLTGHLLMSNIKESVAELAASGEYHIPLTIVIALMSCGLAIKSALFPFHTWVPDAYGYATPSSSAILSSLVSKGYIFLLIKIYYRVIGLDVVVSTGITAVLFVFGLVGMIIGSVRAMQQNDILQMTAYSSVAQIGYVFMGIGFGTDAGMIAAIFHIFSHAASKSMLFLASDGMVTASGGSKHFRDLKGAGFRAPLAGIAFTVGALSMVGFPFLGGFISKLNFAMAGMAYGGIHMYLALATLALSTLLNVMYFLKTVVTIYSNPPETASALPKTRDGFGRVLSEIILIAVNFGLGVLSSGVMSALATGMQMFG